jgi:hypothetical protein
MLTLDQCMSDVKKEAKAASAACQLSGVKQGLHTSLRLSRKKTNILQTRYECPRLLAVY